MTVEEPGSEEQPDLPDRPIVWHWRDHIGALSGIVLGLLALAFLVLLASAGDPSALGIVVVVVIGVALIFFGGQLHGSRGRRRARPRPRRGTGR